MDRGGGEEWLGHQSKREIYIIRISKNAGQVFRTTVFYAHHTIHSFDTLHTQESISVFDSHSHPTARSW